MALCFMLNAQQISTNSSNSLENLIQTTLGQGCVEITNISSSINGSIDNLSSYGSFTKETSNFPFQSGLLLSTGSVNSAGNGLNSEPLNDGSNSWGTDPDLETVLGITGTLNATSIEFDFISAANSIAFNYLLASEEYFGDNPCRYSDKFAFLIKEAGSAAPYTNIALLPGTSIPVSTTNIHPKIEGSCPAENPQYFEGYNLGDTNYNGRTTKLTASTNIVPNVTYHIKIVIADQVDHELDSAVFIEGNSFNATVDLGPDITTCANVTTLNSNSVNPLATYEWFKDNILISEAKDKSIEVTASGNYRVEVRLPLGNSFCKIEDTINVTLNVQDTLPNIPNYILCDDASNDGKESFDLSTRNDDVLQSLPTSTYTITYHLTSQDSQSGENPKTIIENTSNPQDIYIRIYDEINKCASLSGGRLVVNPSPVITTPKPLKICDVDAVPDGLTEIDLTLVDAEITSKFTDLSDLFVTYHLNLEDANAGNNALFSPYTNSSANETLYARLYDASTGCFSTTTLGITVSKAPIIKIEKPFINACNDVGDGFATFDIASELNTILDGLNGVSASVHATSEEAENNSNPISNIGNYQNVQANLQVVYIRLVDNLTGCFSIFPLELHTNIALTGLNTEDFNGCDNLQTGIVDFDLNAVEGHILDNYEGFEVEFFENDTDQENNINPLDKTIPFVLTSSPTLIYATVTSLNCTELIAINLTINSPFVLDFSNPVPPVWCDKNQDGKADVVLEFYDSYVTRGIDNATVEYFKNQNDVEPIEDAYIYVDQSKVIYVRVTDNSTSCSAFAPLTINVVTPPTTIGYGTISICKDPSDGYNIVDLTSVIDDIVPDTNGFKISYYNNSNLAFADENPIADPVHYRSSPFKYIAVRIEDEITGCFSIGAIYIYINSPPKFPQSGITNFQNCNSDGSNVADFYFNEKDEEILNGQTQKIVLYYEDPLDAENREVGKEIDKFSAYRNTTGGSQTIYVRVEAENDSTCYATSTFVLEVDNLPSFNDATDVFVCDDLDNNGKATFDLSIKETEIRVNSTDKITFYTSNEDAENNDNPIPNLNFTNTVNPQTIIARIDNGTFCYSLTSFIVNVVPLPQVEAPTDLYFCDTNLSSPGVYDLQVVKILDSRPENIRITYHESEDDVFADIKIPNPENYTNTSNGQTVYAKINNTLSDDDCFVTLPITLNIATPPTTNDFKEYPVCTNPERYFDLTNIDGVISSESNIQITYFNSSNDAMANELDTALDTDYNYTSANDQIFARLENTITGCVSYYDFTIVETPLPIANKPNDLQGCDDDSDGKLVFDLSDQSGDILGNQSLANHIITYHESQIAADNGTSILDNSYAAIDGQTLYVRVLNTETGCFSTTEFSTIVHPRPNVNIPDQSICSNNPTDSVIVNADTHNPTDTYLWSTGETTPEIEIRAVGIYSVTVTGDFGCQTTQEFNVLEYESATIESIETVDFTDPNNITITISGSGNYLFSLDGGPPQESNVFQNVTLGSHMVSITDAVGCTEINKEVVVIDAPKFMTPNNDGYFDTWHISGIETLPGSTINIYDRYGKLLTTLTSSSKGWDGTYNGRLLPSTDYWFFGKIKKDNNTFEVKGHFSLKL
ncbi:T9SS type B sorting domain-containing protein [Gelidibacter mesophilus]|uniref:T9SS type B sorting domain-containing protein n=1 Tax=Gelidibacter mesophilus TaxID=169050 RepID=UPI0004092BB2|nr:choice-of-anchor L domain-containing protein [Gelidibacter mesophilus]